jgi:3D (Asp-Asp-Asp) domain-containing protein
MIKWAKKYKIKKGEMPKYLLEFCWLMMWAAALIFVTQNRMVEAYTSKIESEVSEMVEIDEIAEQTAEVEDVKYIGTFTATGYCACEICCGIWADGTATTASGTTATAGRTVGADWNTLSAGTELIIEGYGTFIVEDKPAQWIVERYNGRILDIFFNSHEEALQFGKSTVDVYVKEKN